MKTIVNREEAVRFFQSLGFPRAVEWDSDRLLLRLSQVPERVEVSEVEEGWKTFHALLCDGAADGFQFEVPGKVDTSELDLNALRGLIEERGLVIKNFKKLPVEKLRVAVAKALGSTSAKKPEPAPAKVKPVQEELPLEKAPRRNVVKVGSVIGRVKDALSGKWMTDVAIAEAAKLPLFKVRHRLYQLKGLEKRKCIEYRLAGDQ